MDDASACKYSASALLGSLGVVGVPGSRKGGEAGWSPFFLPLFLASASRHCSPNPRSTHRLQGRAKVGGQRTTSSVCLQRT